MKEIILTPEQVTQVRREFHAKVKTEAKEPFLGITPDQLDYLAGVGFSLVIGMLVLALSFESIRSLLHKS
ncbi:hypothetical protein PTW35_24820 (plasmid) [Photobacterium sp. DA100]|uniref:hypothetical protein n=1 Tax=Photobacterium sp. DA100 TaxID=3027472 RepID=UPI0024792919|nr:hypothetical protein [Photobacterium sp. DA100]WEM44497.1 hypothetical protein PTW35_24820 [Photobacterium sp. DA100]